jgi:hypothetical protein
MLSGAYRHKFVDVVPCRKALPFGSENDDPYIVHVIDRLEGISDFVVHLEIERIYRRLVQGDHADMVFNY